MICQSYRGRRLEVNCVMEDAKGKKTEPFKNGYIQETGHEQRPARMVGLLSLDSAQSSMEAGVGSRWRLPRFGGKG